jgi:hypothetical protein
MVQKMADGQDAPDTATRLRGVCSIDQRFPFQRSASGIDVPPAWNQPTATHAVVETHDTPLNWLFVAAGIAIRWFDQPDANAIGAPAKQNTRLADTASAHATIRVIKASGPSTPLTH